MTYFEKLKDPRWQKKRLKIMERDGFACIWCGRSDETLNVHHVIYHRDPWDAGDDDLITLCETHHEIAEMVIKDIKRACRTHGGLHLLGIVAESIEAIGVEQTKENFDLGATVPR